MDIQEAMKHKKYQYKVADKLREERLERVNSLSKPVIMSENIYSKYGKRFIDFILSLLLLIITLPINIIIAIITFIDVGKPIIFKQIRTGRKGIPFTIIKFRNMRNSVDSNGELLPASQRVTKWGKIVRKASLDELLNFWSILKGDMSIIGPRPLPPQYNDRYSDRHKQRLLVRPGLECPPHRGDASEMRTWQDQFENDIWYVENLSFKTDLLMVVRLIQFALNRKNAEWRSQVTRGSFIGYSENCEAIGVPQVPEEYVLKILNQETSAVVEQDVEGINICMTI